MIMIEPRTVYCQPAVVVATIVAYEKLKDIHKEQLTVSNPFSCGPVFFIKYYTVYLIIIFHRSLVLSYRNRIFTV